MIMLSGQMSVNIFRLLVWSNRKPIAGQGHIFGIGTVTSSVENIVGGDMNHAGSVIGSRASKVFDSIGIDFLQSSALSSALSTWV